MRLFEAKDLTKKYDKTVLKYLLFVFFFLLA